MGGLKLALLDFAAVAVTKYAVCFLLHVPLCC